MTALISNDLVLLDLESDDRVEGTRQLAERLAAAGRVTDLNGFLADVKAREEQAPTGLPGGIGIPHARSAHVTVPTLGFARLPKGVDWGAEDGPATLVFLIAAPDGGGSEHLAILASLAFGSSLRAPHGGLWVTPLIGGVFPYLIALVIGTVITAVVVVTLKQLGRRSSEDVVVDKEALTPA